MIAQVFVLLRLMFALLLPRGEKDVLFRLELAQAIAAATPDAEEQFTLVRLARYESGFRRNVARCDTHAQGATMRTEDHGKSFGTFQIQPMNGTDAKLVCGDLPDQVDVALRYLRRSAEICPKNVGAAKLHLYVSGRCDWGHKEAVLRWGGQDLLPQEGEPVAVADATLDAAAE